MSKELNNLIIDNETYEIADSQARRDISLLKNRKFIFIGDSYAQGYTTNGIVESWITKTANILGLVKNSTYYSNFLGGTGFKNAVNEKTFTTLLTDLSITDKESITDIVVLGGYNDKEYDSSEINVSIDLFISTAKTNYPNARIHIGEVGWSPSYQNRQTLRTMIRDCYLNLNSRGAYYIENIQFAIHNYTWNTDNFGHPNEEGQKSIANALVGYLLTGRCSVDLGHKGSAFGGGSALVSVKNDLVHLTTRYSFLTKTFTLGYEPTEITDLFSSVFIKGANAKDIIVFTRPCILALADGKYKKTNVLFHLYDGKTYIQVKDTNDTGSAFATYNVTGIQVMAGNDVFSSYDV